MPKTSGPQDVLERFTDEQVYVQRYVEFLDTTTAIRACSELSR
jgi:hypothetical protein